MKRLLYLVAIPFIELYVWVVVLALFNSLHCRYCSLAQNHWHCLNRPCPLEELHGCSHAWQGPASGCPSIEDRGRREQHGATGYLPHLQPDHF